MASGHHSTLKKEAEKKAPLPRHHPHSNSHSPPHDATPSKESSGSTMATMLQHGTTEEAFTRAAACCSPRRPQKQHNCPRPKPHTHSPTALSPAHSHTNYPDTSALRCRSWIHARGGAGGGHGGGCMQTDQAESACVATVNHDTWLHGRPPPSPLRIFFVTSPPSTATRTILIPPPSNCTQVRVARWYLTQQRQS